MFYTFIGTRIKFQTKRIYKLTSIVEKSSATNYATSIPTLGGMQHSVRIFCHLMVKHYISYAKRREINPQICRHSKKFRQCLLNSSPRF
jgi:hypothetical protein